MESLNALLQGMGLMHLGAGQAIMLLVSLLLLWLAIAKKFEPLLLLPIGFGGLLSNIPEAGLALTALESLLAHHDAGQLAVIAAKLNCAPDVHAIKEALALALPSVQSQMENLAVDMGYTPGVLALFYKVAIGSGVAPLLGMFCFGNLMRESGVVERLSDTVQNGLINIVTIFLGLSVGAKLVADKFLQPQTLGILLLGVVAFGIGTAAGVLMAKLLNLCSKNKINPLIGSAGVSAVPMAARVSNKVGLESDPQNFLLMHAMGPNVAGVIGSAIAAGVMLKYVLAM
ncbi:sodium ion-translocating decarboxylase subunit beta [Salmonella enterica subsp. enterica]|nr:sodium ion-translocating decarboxylase subunit beta [Salmonella enterica]EDU7066001.1 sodium ion-translocating decarboxylase subunit beta [Salmonella enterica subsp. enterica serovar Java]EDV9877824.1 sodium ion-translocating decarboxylase subunit beta [Salmonella enterica subsp. enterica serovar 4,[5],12:b:-]EED5794281.1 sodium ion-translocating decarboxylase subunit beta [Salmonella enterica subsp. enterica]HCM2032909.1 sodium ion-translocating decarboxylase subunit beta [Salmonella enteri